MFSTVNKHKNVQYMVTI